MDFLKRCITCALALVVLALAGHIGPSVQAQEVDARDVEAFQQGTRVVITYALIGETGAEHKVSLRVSSDGGRSFQIEPSAVSGAIGEGVESGKEKKIIWDVREDFPEGLKGEGYKFKVVVRRVGSDGLGSLGIGAITSSGFGSRLGTVCCGTGGRLLWDPNEYPVGLSLDIEYWKSVRVNRWSMRINYTYNKKIVNVGIYNTFSFGDVDIHRSGLVAKTGVSLHSAYIGISVRYPVYFSIMNGEFSEFGLDRYVIFTPNVTVRF